MRRAAFGLVAVMGGALMAAWWAAQPREPADLFAARCSTCHGIPDLSGYAPEDMAAIVRTMRTQNGANQVINDREAALITRYLEEWRRQL